MEVQIGVAKINKYASSESGDSLEVVERPGGGVSIVLADGQRSGKSAKRISNMVVRKVISLLAEGVRDGAAARAASDYLYAERGGKVLSTLNILSVDLQSKTVVITRNNPAPVLFAHNQKIQILDEKSQEIGIYPNTRPVVFKHDLEENLCVVAFSDGLVHAGERKGDSLNIKSIMAKHLSSALSSQEIADDFLQQALALEDGRPLDDISVAVLQVLPISGDLVRRMSVRLPVGP